jgi:hypothetical protein
MAMSVTTIVSSPGVKPSSREDARVCLGPKRLTRVRKATE